MLGETFFYQLPEGPNAGAKRPAIITADHGDGFVGATVFLCRCDGLNPSGLLLIERLDLDDLSGNPDAPAPSGQFDHHASGSDPASSADEGETDAGDGE